MTETQLYIMNEHNEILVGTLNHQEPLSQEAIRKNEELKRLYEMRREDDRHKQ